MVERRGRFLRNPRYRRDFRREAVESDHVIWAEGDGTADSVFELADIARKRVRPKG